MPTPHLICGLPGPGKTTLARQLERHLPALRLTPDEWMARIVGEGYDEAKRAALGAGTKLHFLDVSREELLRRLALRNRSAEPDTFPVTEAQLDLYSIWFEPPSPHEFE